MSKKKVFGLEVGDYIRTKRGKITRVIKIERVVENNMCNIYWGDNEDLPNECNYSQDDIRTVGESYSDLVELGDYINGYPVKHISVNGEYTLDNSREEIIYKDDVKTFLTKEHFEGISLKIGSQLYERERTHFWVGY